MSTSDNTSDKGSTGIFSGIFPVLCPPATLRQPPFKAASNVFKTPRSELAQNRICFASFWSKSEGYRFFFQKNMLPPLFGALSQ